MEQFELPLRPERRIYTVSELNAALRALLEREFQDIWVAGEISGVRPAASGHVYFSLKDDASVLRCVVFRSTLRYLRFKPEDGIAVLARGRLDLWEARGEYQMLVEYLEPQGAGALQVAFEQLKKKLAAEGLFDPARKRPLPRIPRRIGIVTSPAGAVICDMLKILERRFPALHIRIYPALVQGEGSVEDVCRGLEYFGRTGWPDVVVLARGGGSLEDLWTFNEEAVARAIAACPVPVVSAIGHETDFTIADFAADLRAPTPSAAAEMLTPSRQQLLEQLGVLLARMRQAVRYRLSHAARALEQRGLPRASSLLGRRLGRAFQRVDELDFRLRELAQGQLQARRRRLEALQARLRMQDLRWRFSEVRRRLQAARQALEARMRERLAGMRARLEPLVAQLSQLSPLRVLERGYAIVQDEAGRVVKDASEAPPATRLHVRLARGRLRATVIESSHS
ncbi:MAG: exodeoxyribonuclease VII large subunit [Bryobacterales bacterium]|nr:exodeoxyribonuclease VII large subunit [Bryobacteraceae bacterium]MDW8130596.1 exodeoxyribonuclease VII large subunit [Bryobacterales bacterium]